MLFCITKTHFLKFLLVSGRFLFTLYGFGIFLIMMVLLFPFIVIASFFGKVRGGNMIYSLCRFWGDACLFLGGIYHTNIYEAPHDRSKPYIFVSNHISYFDIPVMMKAVRNQHMRILGKAEMEKIPIFGFIYRKAVVLVQRDNIQQRAQSVQTLKSILKRKISVFICPEGTFNMTHEPLKKFFDGAFRIAIETQTPIKPILLLDSYDRMNYNSIFSLNPGKSRAVYLPETNTVGLTLKDVPSLKQKIFLQMEEGLIRYKASWIQPPLSKA